MRLGTELLQADDTAFSQTEDTELFTRERRDDGEDEIPGSIVNEVALNQERAREELRRIGLVNWGSIMRASVRTFRYGQFGAIGGKNNLYFAVTGKRLGGKQRFGSDQRREIADALYPATQESREVSDKEHRSYCRKKARRALQAGGYGTWMQLAYAGVEEFKVTQFPGVGTASDLYFLTTGEHIGKRRCLTEKHLWAMADLLYPDESLSYRDDCIAAIRDVFPSRQTMQDVSVRSFEARQFGSIGNARFLYRVLTGQHIGRSVMMSRLHVDELQDIVFGSRAEQESVLSDVDLYRRNLGDARIQSERKQHLKAMELIEKREKFREAVLTTGYGMHAALRMFQKIRESGIRRMQRWTDFPDKKNTQANWQTMQRVAAQLESALHPATDGGATLPSAPEVHMLLGEVRLSMEKVSEIMHDMEALTDRMRTYSSSWDAPESCRDLQLLVTEAGGTSPPAFVACVEQIRRIYDEWQHVRHELFLANAAIVLSMAGEYRENILSKMELTSEGNEGLLHALDTFRSIPGVQLTTHLGWQINKRIRMAMRKERRAGKMEHPEDWLHEQADDDHVGLDHFSVSEDTKAPAPMDRMAEADRQSVILNVLDALSDDQKNVMVLLFGLDNGGTGRTLEEVAAALDISVARAQQLSAEARERLGNTDHPIFGSLTALLPEDHRLHGAHVPMFSLPESNADRRMDLCLCTFKKRIPFRIIAILERAKIYTVADYRRLTQRDKDNIPQFGPGSRELVERVIAELQLAPGSQKVPETHSPAVDSLQAGV